MTKTRTEILIRESQAGSNLPLQPKLLKLKKRKKSNLGNSLAVVRELRSLKPRGVTKKKQKTMRKKAI